MYIQPTSVVHLLQGVPLDNTYKHTMIFDTAVNQYSAFFNGFTRKAFTALSYVRHTRDSLKIQVKADDIFGYNYMMFQNGSYGSKWFYAFITSVEYVNDNTSRVNYEIDVMQTWLFDAILEPSYVEREHTATDIPGQYLLPEPVDLGRIICWETQTTNYFDSYCAVIAMANDALTASISEDSGWLKPMTDEEKSELRGDIIL